MIALFWVAVAILAAAWALTEATHAIGRWADRNVARQFHEAGVAYGPLVKYGAIEPSAIERAERRVDEALWEGWGA